MSEERIDFFISYTRNDKQWAQWIAWQLQEVGYSTRIQVWDFRPGSNFVLEMDMATKIAKRTIVVLSESYIKACYPQPEWAAAFRKDPTGQHGTLLPVRVQECELDGLLASISYIDLVGLDEETAMRKLITGVKRERLVPQQKPKFPGDR